MMGMRFQKFTWLICLLMLLPFGGKAQLFSSRHFNEEKGLLQKFIFSMTQAPNGVLVLGTEKGVVSFNGDRFVTTNTSHGMVEDQVSCVFAGSGNTTWVGHFRKGISCIVKGVVSVVDSSDAVKGRISSFAEDRNGDTWGISDGKGIFHINALTKKVNFPAGGNIPVMQLAFDPLGQLIAGRDDGAGIYRVEKDGSILLLGMIPETQGKRVTTLCTGKLNGHNMLYAGVEGEGIYCFSLTAGKYKLLTSVTTDLRSEALSFSALASSLTGDLWVGTIGEGLRKVTFNAVFVPERVEVYREATGLADDNVKSLLVDNENNLWLGTFGRGLMQLPYSVFRFHTPASGLLRPEVNCIVQDRSGAFWTGNNTGITRFRKDGKEASRFFNGKNGFSSAKVTCLIADTAGMIWIGTAGDGIYRLDPAKEKFENISARHKLTSKNINTITATRDGRILFGTTDGLYIYRRGEESFTYATTLDGLMHNNIQQLYTDHDGKVWFSSAGTPPYVLEGEEITVFQEIEKLKGYNINGVYQDEALLTWIATDGDGVFSFDGENFHQYSTAHGLKSANCIAVITGDDHLLWVVHKSGLSVKFPGDTLFYSFSDSDNKLFADLSPFVYKDSSGVIYLCSNHGLVEISSRDKSFLRLDPQISLARYFVNGKEHFPENELTLQPGTYNLSFEFNNILYSLPYSPPFYYRIIGADSVWRPAGGRSIIIPQLGSGNYTLEVSSSRSGKTPGSRIYAVKIFIDKPFWEKPWFIVLVLISVPLVIFFLVRLQTLSLMKMNQKLQMLVGRKTKQLEEEKEYVSRINQELAEKNKDITDSILYARRIQLAMLPDLAVLANQFPDNFVFYQPRDIVSGDFYWFAQKGPLFIIAAVDCTGHGIPGAFMSMIGTTLLNKIVFDYNITDPAEILKTLNKDINLSLHQEESSDSSHDGMDIALCAIDKEKKELRFSGAGRPMYLWRNGEVLMFKTNKGGIGGVYGNIFPEFGEEVVKLENKDCVYIFSDGYADQFGEKTQSKFSSRRLRELLQKIGHLPMNDQGIAVRDAFFNWKGNELQFDDVLVMGFKIED